MESIIWMGWRVSIIENTTLSFPPFLFEMACKVLLSDVSAETINIRCLYFIQGVRFS